MSDLALIPVRDCDVEELLIVNDALREENLELKEKNETFQRSVQYYMNKSKDKLIVEADVTKARISIHTTSALAVYTICCVAADGTFSFVHPLAAAVIGSLSLFVWTVVSAVRKFS